MASNSKFNGLVDGKVPLFDSKRLGQWLDQIKAEVYLRPSGAKVLAEVKPDPATRFQRLYKDKFALIDDKYLPTKVDEDNKVVSAKSPEEITKAVFDDPVGTLRKFLQGVQTVDEIIPGTPETESKSVTEEREGIPLALKIQVEDEVNDWIIGEQCIYALLTKSLVNNKLKSKPEGAGRKQLRTLTDYWKIQNAKTTLALDDSFHGWKYDKARHKTLKEYAHEFQEILDDCAKAKPRPILLNQEQKFNAYTRGLKRAQMFDTDIKNGILNKIASWEEMHEYLITQEDAAGEQIRSKYGTVAEVNAINGHREICQHYVMTGNCRHGDNCRHIHPSGVKEKLRRLRGKFSATIEEDDGGGRRNKRGKRKKKKKKKEQICWEYYYTGKCSFGRDKCKFKHKKRKPQKKKKKKKRKTRQRSHSVANSSDSTESSDEVQVGNAYAVAEFEMMRAEECVQREKVEYAKVSIMLLEENSFKDPDTRAMLDSGATHGLTNNRAKLINIKPTNMKVRGVVGIKKVKEKGTYIGCKGGTIDDVLLLESAPRDIIPVNAIRDKFNGDVILGDKARFYGKDGNKTVLGPITENGWYRLERLPGKRAHINSIDNTSEDDSSDDDQPPSLTENSESESESDSDDESDDDSSDDFPPLAEVESSTCSESDSSSSSDEDNSPDDDQHSHQNSSSDSESDSSTKEEHSESQIYDESTDDSCDDAGKGIIHLRMS